MLRACAFAQRSSAAHFAAIATVSSHVISQGISAVISSSVTVSFFGPVMTMCYTIQATFSCENKENITMLNPVTVKGFQGQNFKKIAKFHFVK